MENFQNNSPELRVKFSDSVWPGVWLIPIKFFVIFLSSFGEFQESSSVSPRLLLFRQFPFHHSRIILPLPLYFETMMSFVSGEQNSEQSHYTKIVYICSGYTKIQTFEKTLRKQNYVRRNKTKWAGIAQLT
jgi:hypothetical protein